MKPASPLLLLTLCLLCGSLSRAHSTEPNAWLFDMGSDQSPLWAGFIRVTPATTYDTRRGYGWLNPPDDLRVKKIATMIGHVWSPEGIQAAKVRSVFNPCCIRGYKNSVRTLRADRG